MRHESVKRDVTAEKRSGAFVVKEREKRRDILCVLERCGDSCGGGGGEIWLKTCLATLRVCVCVRALKCFACGPNPT